MRTALAALVLITLAGAATAQNAPRPERQSLLHDGLDRGYYVVEPAAVAAGTALVPAVIVLHGGGGNAFNAIDMTRFDLKAEEEGFIAVFPDGTSSFLLTWNARHCCAQAMRENVDDIGFIAALIDELVEDYPVDPNRIYVTGMSNGAMMTHLIGALLSDRVAAIAPVVGAVFGDEPLPLGPVPAIIINGADDGLIPFEGGPPLAEDGPFGATAWDGTARAPSPAQADYWAAANGCAPVEPVAIETATYVLWRYDCPLGAEVELYLVLDNGHAWPGGPPSRRRAADVPTTAFDATDVIWEFFARHALSAR